MVVAMEINRVWTTIKVARTVKMGKMVSTAKEIKGLARIRE